MTTDVVLQQLHLVHGPLKLLCSMLFCLSIIVACHRARHAIRRVWPKLTSFQLFIAPRCPSHLHVMALPIGSWQRLALQTPRLTIVIGQLHDVYAYASIAARKP
ncbi:MAG: hypothetical protein ACKPKO_43000, partial [Candidatus Fonsibacter sp.]